jgi:hypothetical protein
VARANTNSTTTVASSAAAVKVLKATGQSLFAFSSSGFAESVARASGGVSIGFESSGTANKINLASGTANLLFSSTADSMPVKIASGAALLEFQSTATAFRVAQGLGSLELSFFSSGTALKVAQSSGFSSFGFFSGGDAVKVKSASSIGILQIQGTGNAQKIVLVSGFSSLGFFSSATAATEVGDMAITFKARSYKRGKLLIPEVRLALGPVAEGVTNSGSFADLFGYHWALALDKSGTLHLLRQSAGVWGEVVPLSAFPVLGVQARHIALAFDQAARPVVAWEVSSQIFIRQYNGGSGVYVTRGPFAGCDPVLIMDATVNGDVPSSDVLLGHLSSTRDEFVLRAQRELYAIPRVLTVPTNSVLDATFSKNYAVQFYGVGADGMAWFIGSELYPVLALENLSSGAVFAPMSGSYDPVVIIYDANFENLSSGAVFAPMSGSYDPVVIIYDANFENLSSGAVSAPATGSYDPVVIIYDAVLSNLTSSAVSAPMSGSYDLAVVVHNGILENLSSGVISAPTGGVYALA